MPRNAVRGLGAAAVLAVVLLNAAVGSAADGVDDGAPITPQFAQVLYDRVAPLREPDGCQLTRFDTSRFRITIGLHAASGAEHLRHRHLPGLLPVQRAVGDWAVGVRPSWRATAARRWPRSSRCSPRPARRDRWHVGSPRSGPPSQYMLFATPFGSCSSGRSTSSIARRRCSGRPPRAVVALVLVWAIGAGLRLWLSPRTFLHEYYHIAETVPAYLSGEVAPGYGKTGPALFRLVGRCSDAANDVQVIFLTNAVLSSLAIPAVALLDLALIGSWPQALCAAVLLGVLPQHLRFSAAEDLFVQAVTFGMWALALFALYLRTRRLEDALLAALALVVGHADRGRRCSSSRPSPWRCSSARPAARVARAVRAAHARWRSRVLPCCSFRALLELQRSLQRGRARRPPRIPPCSRTCETLVLLQPRDHAVALPAALLVGAAWAALRRPGLARVGRRRLPRLHAVLALDLRQPAVPSALAAPADELPRPDRAPARRRCGWSLWRARPSRRRRRRCRAPGGLRRRSSSCTGAASSPSSGPAARVGCSSSAHVAACRSRRRCCRRSRSAAQPRRVSRVPAAARPARATRWSTSGAPPAARSRGPPPRRGPLYYQGMFCYFAFDEASRPPIR